MKKSAVNPERAARIAAIQSDLAWCQAQEQRLNAWLQDRKGGWKHAARLGYSRCRAFVCQPLTAWQTELLAELSQLHPVGGAA